MKYVHVNAASDLNTQVAVAFTVRLFFYYFASAAVAVDSSHMTVSSSASWSRFSPPSNFVNGHVSTMCDLFNVFD